jgi:hypothetical protein
MNVTVFGATGGVGREVVTQAFIHGLEVARAVDQHHRQRR